MCGPYYMTLGQYFTMIAIVVGLLVFGGLVIILATSYAKGSIVGKGPGSICETTANCQTGLTCSSNTCRAVINTRCSKTSDCTGDLLCVSNVCVVEDKAKNSVKVSTKRVNKKSETKHEPIKRVKFEVDNKEIREHVPIANPSPVPCESVLQDDDSIDMYRHYSESPERSLIVDEFHMLDEIGKNMVDFTVTDNQSPLNKTTKLLINNRSILPSSLDVSIIDYVSFRKDVILVAAEGEDEQLVFLFDLETRSILPLTSNVDINQIERVGKHLFAVSSGGLYTSTIPEQEKGNYITKLDWKHVDTPLTQVTHISPDVDRMWVQSRMAGYYMNTNDRTIYEIEDIVEGSKRFCGYENAVLMGDSVNISGQVFSDIYLPVQDKNEWSFISNTDYKNGIRNIKQIDENNIVCRVI